MEGIINDLASNIFQYFILSKNAYTYLLHCVTDQPNMWSDRNQKPLRCKPDKDLLASHTDFIEFNCKTKLPINFMPFIWLEIWECECGRLEQFLPMFRITTK